MWRGGGIWGDSAVSRLALTAREVQVDATTLVWFVIVRSAVAARATMLCCAVLCLPTGWDTFADVNDSSHIRQCQCHRSNSHCSTMAVSIAVRIVSSRQLKKVLIGARFVAEPEPAEHSPWPWKNLPRKNHRHCPPGKRGKAQGRLPLERKGQVGCCVELERQV